MGRRGYERVVEKFNPAPQAELFLSLLHSVTSLSSP
jgi:hypothetical protein